jgi:hypothetical protein
MHSTIQYCHNQKAKFTKDLSTCNGLSLQPNASDKEIDALLKYYLFFEGQSVTDNLLCAWNARKIAMIENDRFPENEDEIEDLLAKYAMIHKCNIKTFVLQTDDDPTTIYYDPSLWKEATLLYMYHLKNHNLNDSPEIMKVEYPEDVPYHIFQGILLGYTKESIRDFILVGDKMKKIIIAGILNANNANKAKVQYTILSIDKKREIYMKCYDTLMAENTGRFEDLYQEIAEYIKYKLKQIDRLRIYKIMALGPNEEMIRSFDAPKSNSRRKSRKSQWRSRAKNSLKK